MLYFKAKMQHSTDLLAGFKGPISKEREEKGGEGSGQKGK